MESKNAAELSHPDPEIADALRAAASTEQILREILGRLGPSHLDEIPPDTDNWSAVETVGHLLDLEIACGHRLRSIISEDSPHFEAFDDEAFVIAQRWRAADLPLLLGAWSALRRVHLALIARLDTDVLARGGVNRSAGPVTARDIVLQLSINDYLNLSRLRQLEEKILRPLA
jgi:hypothetical protein